MTGIQVLKIFKEGESNRKSLKTAVRKDRMWSPLGARASKEQKDFQGRENDNG